MQRMRQNRPSFLLAALPLGALLGAGMAAGGAPIFDVIDQVQPHDGRTVPRNTVPWIVRRSTSGSDELEVHAPVQRGGAPPQLRTLVHPHADEALDVQQLPGLTLEPGADVEFRFSLGDATGERLMWTVSPEEDQSPPTAVDPVVTTSFIAENGQHTGYLVQLDVPTVDDDFGVAGLLLSMDEPGGGGYSTRSVVLGRHVWRGPESALFFEIPASRSAACFRVTSIDYADNRATGAIACTELTPPTQEELQQTVSPALSLLCSCSEAAGERSSPLGLLALGFGVLGLGVHASKRRTLAGRAS